MPWVDVNAKDITEGQKEELPSRRRSCEEMLLSKLAAVPDIEAGRGGGGGSVGALCYMREQQCHMQGSWMQHLLDLATVVSLVVVCVCATNSTQR
jgi:hypothetical protein